MSEASVTVEVGGMCPIVRRNAQEFPAREVYVSQRVGERASVVIVLDTTDATAVMQGTEGLEIRAPQQSILDFIESIDTEKLERAAMENAGYGVDVFGNVKRVLQTWAGGTPDA